MTMQIINKKPVRTSIDFDSTSEQLNSDILNTIDNLPNKNTIIKEANFGLHYIKPYIAQLRPNSTILEVGAGPCVLLSQLSFTYDSHFFTGIEPIGPGFEIFRESLAKLKKRFGFEMHEMGYEQFEETTEGKYDLIFLINVFEHLLDWEDFMRFTKTRLKQNGRCVILCPNYSFPYESHFRIPVILNKSVTFRIFKKYILNFEKNLSLDGLWSSLNFVKLRSVINKARDLNLGLKINTQITNDLINRLDVDDEFSGRQKIIGAIAKTAKKMGLISFFNTTPLILLQPYMFLEITLKWHSLAATHGGMIVEA